MVVCKRNSPGNDLFSYKFKGRKSTLKQVTMTHVANSANGIMASEPTGKPPSMKGS